MFSFQSVMPHSCRPWRAKHSVGGVFSTNPFSQTHCTIVLRRQALAHSLFRILLKNVFSTLPVWKGTTGSNLEPFRLLLTAFSVLAAVVVALNLPSDFLNHASY